MEMEMDGNTGSRLLGLRAFVAALLLLGVVFGALLPTATPAYAVTTFTVDSFADEPLHPNWMPWECVSTPSLRCTLRAAIEASAACVNCQWEIVLPAGTFNLPRGSLVIRPGTTERKLLLTVVGAGAEATIIDGNGIGRVFDIKSGVQVDISGVTIKNGNAGFGGDADGGGIRNASESALSLHDAVIRENVGYPGGGISNRGSLLMTRTTVSNNHATPGGAVSAYGGGILNMSGAIVSDSTISSNEAPVSGGGIENRGTLLLWNSVLAFNRAVPPPSYPSGLGSGGGLSNDHGGTAYLWNVTISGNEAQFGAGIDSVPGPLDLTHVTIAGNRVTGYGGGALQTYGAPATVKNSIIANTRNNSASGGENCSSTVAVTSLGGNLSSDASCAAVFTTLSDRNNVDPQLEQLQVNQPGQTATHALRHSSPAIDAVPTGNCPPPPTDQRGVTRPQGARCDSGAYEHEYLPPPPPPIPTFTPTLASPPPPSAAPTETLTPTVTPMLTPTAIPTPTIPPAGFSCTPRPPVQVQATSTGDGWLRVTITAGLAPFTRIAFGGASPGVFNAIIDVEGGPTGQRAPFVYVPPASATSVSFLVSRVQTGQPTTVQLTVTDACGAWPTFVGGGPTAF